MNTLIISALILTIICATLEFALGGRTKIVEQGGVTAVVYVVGGLVADIVFMVAAITLLK